MRATLGRLAFIWSWNCPSNGKRKRKIRNRIVRGHYDAGFSISVSEMVENQHFVNQIWSLPIGQCRFWQTNSHLVFSRAFYGGDRILFNSEILHNLPTVKDRNEDHYG